MGCASTRKENKISFDDQEIIRIRRLFDRLKSRFPKTASTDYICQESMEYLFEGRSELGAKLFKYMSKHSQNEGKVDFDHFLQVVEILVKSPSAIHLQGFRTLDKTEILILVSLQRIDIDMENYQDQKVSYLEALTFLQDIEYVCIESGLTLNYRPERDESVARSVLQAVYPTSSGSITWWSLMLFLKQLLPHLSNQIKSFFSFLFMTSNPPKGLSRFVKPSYLITNNQFIYLSLGNIYLHNSTSVGLLWGSAQFGWNFKSLFEALMKFDGPTLILLRFEDKLSSGPQDPLYKSSIVGAFNRKKWLDLPTYQGNEENYLFQLKPKFKLFPSQIFKRMFANESDLNTQNYCYLHGEAAEGDQQPLSGLGFGGSLNKNFRIWIDDKDMQNNSYVTSVDETFKNGSLVDPDMTEYRLSYMEVWSMGKETESLSTQLLVEKANHLETQYMHQSLKVHKEVIDIMKSNLSEQPSFVAESLQQQQQSDMRLSRKEKILELIPSSRQSRIQQLPDDQIQTDSMELGKNDADQLLKKYEKQTN